MTTVDQFLKALAITESDDNQEAWGDAGRAMGRWQVHPDRFSDELARRMIVPKVGETWDQVVARMLTNLFTGHQPDADPVSIAMYWHVGHWVARVDQDWDSKYATRFVEALARSSAEVP